MNYEDISETKKFKELLEQIPETERAKVEEAIRLMVKDFNSQVIQPLLHREVPPISRILPPSSKHCNILTKINYPTMLDLLNNLEAKNGMVLNEILDKYKHDNR